VIVPTELGELEAGFEPRYVRQNYLSSQEADTSGTRA
jgi:hypothetical protein